MQDVQVPQGLIEKPVKVRYDPVTVLGSLEAYMSLEQSGKALSGDDLESGELLVWVYKMILTVDEKHILILFCKSDGRIICRYDRFFCNPN